MPFSTVFSRRGLSVRADANASKTTTATRRAPPRAGNVPGQFHVDTTCIDCDLCRRMAPETFTSNQGGSIVYQQPSTREGRVDALQALLSCPTFSIHSDKLDKEELKAAQLGLPKPVPGCPNVYHCGWHSEKSFSAASYLITRPAGNILVDVPRYNPVLARQLEALGGVKYIYLTHRDDVADHQQWAKHFNAPRIMHQADVHGELRAIETQLQGSGPWDFSGQALQDSAGDSSSGGPEQERELVIVHTPGHTRGHTCLYYAPSKVLFAGDHLSQEDAQPDLSPNGQLHIFTDFNWFSVEEQLRSVAKLKEYDFLTVLAGHGRNMRFRDAQHRTSAIEGLLQSHGYRG